MIQESVARTIANPDTWTYTELPSLRGFGNSIIKSIGTFTAELEIDGIRVQAELLIVPDCYLNHQILVGQTVTEQPHINVYKTNELLTIKSESIENKNNIVLKCGNLVEIYGSASIKVCTNTDITGVVYVENGQRLNHRIEVGNYNIKNGIGYVTLVNNQNRLLSFKRNNIVCRGRINRHVVSPKPYYIEINNIYKNQNPIELAELNIGTMLNKDQQKILLALVRDYRDCFAVNLNELGLTTITEMDIQLKDSEPVVFRPYRLSQTERLEVRSMVDELLHHNIIRESTSPYASPILVVKKKTGDKRLCVDYRALNRKTIKQHYPIPRIEDQIDRLAGSKYFCALDLASGYYQIPLAEQSKSKTAFVTPDGQFEFNRMPFGLANAPAIFQRTINVMLGNARFDTAIAYMDDILVPSKCFKEGIERLQVVFEKLRQAKLTLKPQKCKFFQERVEYLGFEVSEEGVRPGSYKVESVRNFPTPKDIHNVRQFLGLASFFRRFIKGFAEIARPLTALLKKDSKWIWGSDQENALQKLKNALTSRPVLALYDPKLETQIHTDASKHGVGSILLQNQGDGVFKPIAYYSRQTSPEEAHFSSYELETLSVIAALIKFRSYILGLNFTIVTDCNSLRATFLKMDMLPRVARWWSLIQEYDCNVIYRSGKGMMHVDALSRNPIVDKIGVVDTIETHEIMNIENDWLVTVQINDSEIKRIKDILSNAEYNDIVEIRKHFVLKRDRVYRITDDGLKWVVPKGCRWQILQKNHDEIGHFGFDKTLERIKQHYWFSRMRRFIKKYVSSCLECAHNKVPSGRKQGFLHPIPKVPTPFHTIHIDHVGPFVTSKRKNSYILVIIDAYTKFIVLKAVKNTKSNTSITVLRDYFGTFGLPKRLISDRGTSFTSLKFKNVMHELGIKHIQNAVASPRANGQVERYNRTILDSLAAQNHGKDERLWDERLLQVQWGLNNTINKGTGKSPSEILFGLKLNNDKEGPLISEIHSDLEEENQCDRLEKVIEIRSGVDRHINESQNRQKKEFDKKRKEPLKYKLGDLVRVERISHSIGKSKKLLPKLAGPYRITKIFNNDRYEITDTPLTRKGTSIYKGVFSVDKIYPWTCFNKEDGECSESETSTQLSD